MSYCTRRHLVGTLGVGAALSLAGCMGGESTDDDAATVPGDEYPAIDEWLTETEVGSATDNYDGVLQDRTGEETVTVDVGASGNGGAFAFSPPALLVSTGTTVEWSWTGEGNPHNVEALPEEQLGKSDYEFSSGEPEGGSGVKYSQTLDAKGTVLYHCEPHLALGMKGAIAVE